MSSTCYAPAADLQPVTRMRSSLLVVLLLSVPAITHAQPPTEKHEHSKWTSRLTDPKVAFGGTLLFGGYAGSILWEQERDGDQNALYVPLFGPWLELLTLPDCGEGDDAFCGHDDATRSILIASGATQLVGAGLIIYSLTREDEDKSRILIAPSLTNGNPGVSVRGRF